MKEPFNIKINNETEWIQIQKYLLSKEYYWLTSNKELFMPPWLNDNYYPLYINVQNYTLIYRYRSNLNVRSDLT